MAPSTYGNDADIDGSVTINESSADKDTRIESDGDTHMLFVDASTNRVGIGVSSPQESLDVDGNLKVSGDDARIKIDGHTNSHPGLEFYENSTRKWIIFNDYTSDNLTFKTDSTERMVIDDDVLWWQGGVAIKLPSEAGEKPAINTVRAETGNWPWIIIGGRPGR